MKTGPAQIQVREPLNADEPAHGPDGSGIKPLRGPERTCLGCRARKAQAELDRLALKRGPAGPAVVRDPQRRLNGRGAWLCRDNSACLAAALKRRAFGRAFRTDKPLDLTAVSAGDSGAANNGGLINK